MLRKKARQKMSEKLDANSITDENEEVNIESIG